MGFPAALSFSPALVKKTAETSGEGFQLDPQPPSLRHGENGCNFHFVLWAFFPEGLVLGEGDPSAWWPAGPCRSNVVLKGFFLNLG